MEKKQVEVLAPAELFEDMKAAMAAGADAVCAGGSRLGARTYVDNPGKKGLLRAIDYIHLCGRYLYVVVNILFRGGELKDLENYIRPYHKRGLDGVVARDLGVLAFIRRYFPGLELHSNTQVTVTSVYGTRMIGELGCSRIVTTREMSLEGVRRIHDEVDIEIRNFVCGVLRCCYPG